MKRTSRCLLALLLTFALVATLVLGALPVAAADAPVLRNGAAAVAADASAAEINAALSEALISNYASAGNAEWEYAATNTYNTYFYETITNNFIPVPQSEKVWVPVAGGTVTARLDDTTFLNKSYAQSGDVQFASIGALEAGTIVDVRIAGTEQTVKLTLLSNSDAPAVTPDPEPDPTPDEKAVITDSGEAYPVTVAYLTDFNILTQDCYWDYDGITQNIIDAVAGHGLTAADVSVKKTSKNLFGNWTDSAIAGTTAAHIGAIDVGTSYVHLVFGGNDKVEPFDLRVQIDLSDQRMTPVIVLKEDAAVTYNKDAAATRQNIFQNAIDFEASTLPAGVSADDFTMEYKSLLLWKGVDALDAGDYTLRLSLPVTPEYHAATVEGALKVEKANVTVFVRPATIYPEEALPENFVTTTPEDDFTIFMFYAGVSSDLAPVLYIQFPSSTVGDTLMKGIDTIYSIFNDGKTFTQRLNEGITVGQLREILTNLATALKSGMENPIVANVVDTVLKPAGFDSDTIISMLTAIENLPGIFDNMAVAVGVPGRAGTYAAAAVAFNKNYNPGFGVGLLIVKQHFFGTKLVWNQAIDGSVPAAEAANFDFGAHAEYKGTTVAGQTVKYSYTGFTSSGRIYISSKVPTEAGRYICTAYTFGGNYITLPTTRIVTISK